MQWMNSSRAWLALLLLLSAGQAAAVTREVPGDFATIQAAINASSDGDIVEVAVGTYRENISLASGVDVRGVEAARTILIAADNNVAIVSSANVTDVLFANFTLAKSNSGVRLVQSSDITLASNIFDGLTGIAVFVGNLSEAEVINNVFYRNNTAIDRFSFAVPVTNNIFAENDFTVRSSLGVNPVPPDQNLDFNCFFRNDDLLAGGVDTGLGDNFQIGDPVFVDEAARDFHLQQTSVCIDAGTGTDVIDETVADMGAYGGEFADAFPFPVGGVTATDSSAGDPVVYNIDLSWDANLAYLITSDVMPGGYTVWYQRNEPGPPYDGMDAGGGTEPSPISVGDVTSYTLTDLDPAASIPGVPVLRSASPQNESVVLDWSAATNATGYRVYYGATAVTDNTINVGNVTSFTLTGLDNGTEYTFAVSAGIQPVYYLAVRAVDSTPQQNQSAFSTEVSLELGDPVESELSNTLTAIPEEVIPYPDLPDKGCFIATAAFGAKWAGEVQVLREFRDKYLLTHAPGRWFVGWYYRNGPTAAEFIERHTELKPLVRALLWPLVALAAFALGASFAELVATAMLMSLLAFVYYRGRGDSISRRVVP